jgi:virginiamycin B lyase
MGVIDEAISAGASSGCAEGFAAVGGPEAWARSIYSSSPSITGGVLGMELAHTFGLVPLIRSDPNSQYHSSNNTADLIPTQPLYRTYDTSRESYISDDHSVMKYAGTFSGANTLLEEQDYACIHFFLGGTVPAGVDCGTTTGTTGTAVGVAAPPAFVMSGTTDGQGPCVQQTTTFCTAAGTKLETYFSGGALPTTPPTGSAYHLRFIGTTGNLLQDSPVGVSFTDSVHDQTPGVTVGTGSSGLIQLAYPFPTGTARVEFWNNGSNALLYAASENGTPLAPTLTSTSGSTALGALTNYTNNGGAFNIQPSVSPDGQWIAWVPQFGNPPNVKVAPSSNASAAVQLTVNSAEPAWGPDGKSLAFVDNLTTSGLGRLYAVTVDTSNGTPVFGTPVLVFTVAGTMHHPSWSPDGKTLVFEFTHRIYSVPVTGGGSTQLTTGGRESSPSWSPDLGGGATRIAFSQQANFCIVAGSVAEYPTPTGNSGPYGITSGPDGKLWFTEGIASKIGSSTTSGTPIVEYPTTRTSPTSQPAGITVGPDGNLWVAESTGPNIARITPAGTLTEFSTGVTGDPLRITNGPDGNLWFTEYNNYSIGTINPSTGSVTERHVPTAGSHPVGIVTGPDGSLWFTEESANKIGRITPGGSFTEFGLTSGSTPESITVGPDGNLWFTESGSNKIGIMNTIGSLVKEIAVPTPSSGVQDIITGPDGNVWFTEFTAGKIGATNGTSVNEYPLPTTTNGPFGIAVGSDGNIWFTEDFASKIGRITVASCPTSMYSVDPSVSSPTPQLITSNAAEPSWASTTQLAFSRPSSGSIWTSNVDGSKQQQLTTTTFGLQDGWPSAQAAGLVAFSRQRTIVCGEFCSSSSDIMLLKTAQTVNVSAAIPTNDSASQIRLDVFYKCGGINYPASIDNPPQSSSAGLAQFTFRYDPSLACPNGSLYAVSNDGFHQSAPSSTVPIASGPKPPVPTIDSPSTQPATCTPFYAPCHFLQYNAIPLRGTAKDAKDGQLSGSALQWSIGNLNLPSGQSTSGDSIDLFPPSGGWTPGGYTVTVTATDTSGLSASTATSIVIDADANNDGLSSSVEAQINCFGNTAFDTGPPSAFADFDGDGISNIDDLYIGNGPCIPATSYTGLAISFPQKIDLGSTASIYAVGLAVPYANLNQVTPSSVQIVAVAGQPAPVANTGWAVANITIPGLDHVNTVAGATFSLQLLIQYLSSQPQLINHTVTITIIGKGTYVNGAGTTVTWQFQVTTQAFVAPGSPPPPPSD